MGLFSKKEELCAAALEYSAKNVLIFPMYFEQAKEEGKKGKKKTITTHGYKDATCDSMQVNEWWTKYPNALIGVPTGPASSLLVIDIDNAETNEKFLEYCEENNFDIRETAWEKSPNGFHYYFYYPSEGNMPACSNGVLFPGVEVKGDGGSVIISPSWYTIKHPDGSETTCRYESVNDVEPLELPEFLLEKIKTLPEMRENIVYDETEEKVAKFTTQEGKAALEKILKDLKNPPANQRNITLYKAACRVGTLIFKGLVNKHDAKEILLQIAHDIGLDISEANATIESGFNSGKKTAWENQHRSQSSGQPSFKNVKIMGETENDGDGQDETKPLFRLPKFPLSTLPKEAADVVTNIANIYNVDEWLPFAAILKCISTVVGANYMMRFGPFKTPAHQWIILVCPPGSMKSSITNLVFEPVHDFEMVLEAMSIKRMDEFERQLEEYEIQKREERKKKDGNVSQIVKPEKPPFVCLTVNDITIEKLIDIFQDNPGGILWENDEIASWICGFNRYSTKNQGTDKAQALSMYEGQCLKYQRVKNGSKTITVPSAWLSVYGTVQPDILPTLLGPEDIASGFMQRFMFICPEDMPPKHLNEDAHSIEKSQLLSLFSGMFEWERLSRAHGDDNGVQNHPFIQMKKEAYTILEDFTYYIKNGSYFLSIGDKSSRIRQVSRSKRWCEQCSRLIFALHCLQSSINKLPQPEPEVSVATVENGIQIFEALMEHSRYAWGMVEEKVFAEKPIKTYISIAEISIIDYIKDLIIENEENVCLHYTRIPENIETKGSGKTCFEILVDRIKSSARKNDEEIKITKKALRTRFLDIGFSEKRTGDGLMYKISKEKFQKLLTTMDS